MIYSSRLKKILHYCLTHRDDYVSLDELANLLKISKRTIFRELKNIDQDLEAYGLTLNNKSGKGIRLEGSDKMKAALLDELKTQGIEYINKEERQNLLMFELLRSSEITKLLHYANMFQVSEATISNDLDVMEPWLKEYHLALIRKKGLGVAIQGKEKDVRCAMTALLHETMQKSSGYDDVNYLDSQTLLQQIFIKDDQNSIMRLLNQDILERILQVFQTYQHELALDRYAQSSYIGLMIHLVIAIDRILKKEEIADNEQVLSMICDDVSFLQAKKMAQYLEIEFDIDIPETEIAFIALHIKGAKINKVEYNVVKQEEVERMTTLIQHILNSYDEDMRLLLLEDEELMHGLLTHLEPTIIRLKNHLPIYNPLLQQIKEMYSTLFAQTKRACRFIAQEFHCDVSDDEVGFITMHIGASLERSKQASLHHREITIGVVCASGIGVSALLSARIAKAFPQGVKLHVLAMEEILRHEYRDCELLVSTFPLNVRDVDILNVSPLLSGDDIQHLRKAMEELQKKEHEMVKENDSFPHIVTHIQRLCATIQDLMEHMEISIIDDDIQYDEILHLIAKEHADTIIQQNMLYEALVKREQQGSVVMPDYGFAMFHATCKATVHNVFHLYYPSNTYFCNQAFTGLKFMVVLLRNEKKEMDGQELLSTLSRSLIDDDAFYQAIIKREEQDIRCILQTILKDYLVEYLEEHL